MTLSTEDRRTLRDALTSKGPITVDASVVEFSEKLERGGKPPTRQLETAQICLQNPSSLRALKSATVELAKPQRPELEPAH